MIKIENVFEEKVKSIAEKYAELVEKKLLNALGDEVAESTALTDINEGIRMLHHTVVMIERINGMDQEHKDITREYEISEEDCVEQSENEKEAIKKLNYFVAEDKENGEISVIPCNEKISLHSMKEVKTFIDIIQKSSQSMFGI